MPLFLEPFLKPLSAQEEKSCLDAYQRGDTKARDILVERNLRLVAHVVIDMSVQVPIWDEAQGRAYTISRFSTELKNFLDEKLGGEYVASVVTMGQGLTVTIK